MISFLRSINLWHGLNANHLHRYDRFATCDVDVCIIINSNVCHYYQ